MGKAVVDELKKEFDIEDEWLPLEIHPETPAEGTPITNLFPSASIEMMFGNLTRMGKQYGLDFKGNRLLSNSHLSLASAEFAKEKGKFQEFHEGLFHAYFTEEKDIGSLKILGDIAESIGLDKAEMAKKLQDGTYEEVLKRTQKEAHQFDIHSTPTFIIDNKYALVGAQPLESFREALLKIES